MNDAGFWRLIGLVGGRPEVQDDRPYERLTALLSEMEVQDIIAFSEELARKLYELDRKVLAEIPVLEADGTEVRLTDDGFLYARCAAIVAGPEAYDAVQARPETFARFGTSEAAHAESLLDVPSNAYKAKTGAEWDHIEEHDYETGSNEQHW